MTAWGSEAYCKVTWEIGSNYNMATGIVTHSLYTHTLPNIQLMLQTSGVGFVQTSAKVGLDLNLVENEVAGGKFQSEFKSMWELLVAQERPSAPHCYIDLNCSTINCRMCTALLSHPVLFCHIVHFPFGMLRETSQTAHTVVTKSTILSRKGNTAIPDCIHLKILFLSDFGNEEDEPQQRQG